MITTVSLDNIHHLTVIISFLVMRTFKIYCLQFSSVTQSCPTLCNPMNHSTPGLPAHHQLPEFT